jgi:hypothetical protein
LSQAWPAGSFVDEVGFVEGEWLSYHFFYHGDRNRLLMRLVHPLVVSLWREKRIDQFFFVRYAFGGPHIRLRLRILPEQRASVEESVDRAASVFFERWPSETPMADDVVRRNNEALVAGELEGSVDSVYPDNSCRRSPFEPEVERYGGPALIQASLDFFALSSIEALRFVAEQAEKSAGRRLALAFRVLLRQALGSAEDGEALLGLLEYSVRYWGDVLAPIVAQADKAFEQGPPTFLTLFREEMENLAGRLQADERTAAPEGEAARSLAWEVREASPVDRGRILTSQLHMTANRLGLKNVEEVYLSRLLGRAGQDVMRARPDLWKKAEGILRERGAAPPSVFLNDLLPAAFLRLAG